MHPYHNRIKQRIKNGELVGYRFVENYPGIGEALLLEFNTLPHIMPIRPHNYHNYHEYVDILADFNRRDGDAKAKDIAGGEEKD